jgi:hypothetical protein
MSESFDSICRTLASPIPRRQALRLVAGAFVGAVTGLRIGWVRAMGGRASLSESCFSLACCEGLVCEADTQRCAQKADDCSGSFESCALLPCCEGFACNPDNICIRDCSPLSFTCTTRAYERRPLVGSAHQVFREIEGSAREPPGARHAVAAFEHSVPPAPRHDPAKAPHGCPERLRILEGPSVQRGVVEHRRLAEARDETGEPGLCHAGRGGAPDGLGHITFINRGYFALILKAPSSRITAPFSMGFS